MTRSAVFDHANDAFATERDTSLDPQDWEAFRVDAHRGLDMMIDYLRDVRDRKVWQPAPAEVRAGFKAPMPQLGKPLGELLETFEKSMLPYATGNTHPLFMGWVHGGGTPVGMVAEMLAAGLNSNCGGRDHIAVDVEREITLWLAEAFDFPRESSGVFVTGSSMANMIATLVARTDVLGEQVRTDGLRASGQLVGYASTEAHACIERAFEMAGVGSTFLRRIPVNEKHEMDGAALRAAIAEDSAAGLTPFIVVGSAGTVNTGAIDDLAGLADICAEEDIWFHVDGAFGALGVLSPELKPLLNGLERADSVALDFHKWLQVPYDAGFFICRHPDLHRQTFMSTAAYLSRAPRGLAAADIWPCDLGPDLSRGFRALKTWFTFQSFGAERLGAILAQTCAVARHLEALIRRSAIFELSADVTLNIVCFSVKGDTTGRINREIVMDLHESGVAAPSTTKIGGRPVIRAAIVNHRTQMRDMETFVAAAEVCAGRVMAERAAPVAP